MELGEAREAEAAEAWAAEGDAAEGVAGDSSSRSGLMWSSARARGARRGRRARRQ